MHDENEVSFTLKEWLGQVEKYHVNTHTAERLARDKAEQALNERLANMNELRGQLDKQAGLFVTRDQLDILKSRVELLEQFESAFNAHSRGINGSWVVGVSVVSMIAVMINLAIILIHL